MAGIPCRFEDRPRHGARIDRKSAARPALDPAGDARHLAACFRRDEIAIETGAAAAREATSGFAVLEQRQE